MIGLLSNEEEIARGILMAHFPLLLRLLFSECSPYRYLIGHFIKIAKPKSAFYKKSPTLAKFWSIFLKQKTFFLSALTRNKKNSLHQGTSREIWISWVRERKISRIPINSFFFVGIFDEAQTIWTTAQTSTNALLSTNVSFKCK